MQEENWIIFPVIQMSVLWSLVIRKYNLKSLVLYMKVILTGQIMPSKDKQASLVALLEKYSKDFLEKGMQYIRAAKDKTGVYVIYPERITGKAKRISAHS